MKSSAASLLVWVFIAQASCPVLTFQQSLPILLSRRCATTSPRGPRACISTSISALDITSAVDGLTGCSDIPYGMYAISGAISGASRSVARLLSYPLDTIKTLAQAESLDKDEREMQRIADKAVPRTFADLFRGVLISIVSAVPANSIFIVCFNSLDAYVPCLDRSSPLSFVLDWSAPAQHILFSAIATVPQNLFKIPAELIKQRSQLAKQRSQGADTRALPSPPSISSPPRSDSDAYLSGPFSSGVLQVLGDARQLIIRFGGLYQGGGAMMLREVPFNAVQMATFYYLTEQLDARPHIFFYSDASDAVQSGLVGLAAAGVAALVTQPADTIKTRMMKEDGAAYSVATMAAKIWRASGWQGLYVGLGSRMLLVSIGGLIYFATMEVTGGTG